MSDSDDSGPPPLEDAPQPQDGDDEGAGNDEEAEEAWARLVVAAGAVQLQFGEITTLANHPGLAAARLRDDAAAGDGTSADMDVEGGGGEGGPGGGGECSGLEAELRMLCVGTALVRPIE